MQIATYSSMLLHLQFNRCVAALHHMMGHAQTCAVETRGGSDSVEGQAAHSKDMEGADYVLSAGGWRASVQTKRTKWKKLFLKKAQ